MAILGCIYCGQTFGHTLMCPEFKKTSVLIDVPVTTAANSVGWLEHQAQLAKAEIASWSPTKREVMMRELAVNLPSTTPTYEQGAEDMREKVIEKLGHFAICQANEATRNAIYRAAEAIRTLPLKEKGEVCEWKSVGNGAYWKMSCVGSSLANPDMLHVCPNCQRPIKIKEGGE